MLEPELIVFIQQFMVAARDMFEHQRFEIIQLFSQEKAPDKPKGINDKVKDLFSQDDYIIALDAQFQPIYAQLMSQAAQYAQLVLPIAGEPLQDTPEWTNWITQRSGQIAKDINAETQKQILATLRQGVDNGENVHQLRARLEKVFGEGSSVRAEKIARTESKKAASQADLFVWGSTDVVVGKEWFAQSGNPCPWCESMEGRTVGLRDNFFNLNDTHEVDVVDKDGNQKTISRKYGYEAIVAPPLHPNCQCILLPVL